MQEDIYGTVHPASCILHQPGMRGRTGIWLKA